MDQYGICYVYHLVVVVVVVGWVNHMCQLDMKHSLCL